MRARHNPGRMGVLAVVVFAMGCTAGTVPPNRFYRLQVDTPATTVDAAAPKLNGVLVVQRFRAAGLIDERPILYSESTGLEVRQHHYHHWVDPPTDMIQEHMVAYLRATKAASVVTTPESRIRGDFVLRGRISRFEHILVDGAHRVLIETQVSLKDATRRHLLFSDTYRAEAEASGQGMEAVVEAFNRSVREILGQVARDVSAH